MAGGHGYPLEKLQNLSKTELLLHKIAMNRMRNLPGKQAVVRQSSGVYEGRDFALENRKLKDKVDQLEKEKQQCIHKHKEDAHMFRMSVKLPPQCSEEYWSQYGEKFHANGDFRENSSLLRLPPQPSPRQQPDKTRKERHCTCDTLKNNKPKPCKTVSDLITLMREATPNITSTDPTAHARPLSSSSVTGGGHQNLDNFKSESLHKLRALLENYEMFVPSESDVEEEEDEEEEKDKSLSDKVEEKKKIYQQSRSKSVDDIKKVELLRLTKVKADRLTRSQSAQTNQVKQGLQRKKTSAPARDIAHGALRVHSLQPSVCKYDIKNQSLTKSSEALFKSPSKRVPERTESSASLNESHSENKDLDEIIGSLQKENARFPRGIDSQNRMKSARAELSFKKECADNRNDSHDGLETTRVGREPEGVKEGDVDLDCIETFKKESLGTIAYCFSERGGFYSNMEETELHIRKIPVRFTSGYPREETSISRTSRDVCSRRTRYEDRYKSRSPSDSFPPGKVSIKNILPDFPLDIEALRRASKKNVVSTVNEETNPARKQLRYWRPKPKSAAKSFGKRRSTLTEHDAKEVNRQPDHLAHASVKARRTAMIVLGKGLIDNKKQERETREKMDQFFARLDSTKNGGTSVLHAAAPTRPNTATLRSRERRLKKQEYHRKTERMYKRAAPWPVQVWC